MTTSTPRELQQKFLEHFLASDLEGLLSLYEVSAAFVTQTGETLMGSEDVRASLAGFVGIPRTSFTYTPTFAAETDGVVLMHADWSLEGTDPDGKPLMLGGTTIEVARRQAGGTWRYAVDSPFGIIS
ncbi:YybH family protein [Nocardia sp. NPDC050630]|uniref:YybH family protein n=1 Tax=Nocardia sp. NPDC050630 TaxID=3364321 RepID=UPI0037A9E47D